jgi:hypothetical protein
MGVVIQPDSELGKELQRWEQFPVRTSTGETLPAGNPYVFRPYPKMLYKAHPFRTGKTLCFAPAVSPFGWTDPNQYQQALIEADAFNKSCQRIVGSESDHAIAKGQGWCETPDLALAFHEQQQDAIGQAAAEAAYSVQRMGEKARGEFDAASDATDVHVTDVPAPKRRGRKPKNTES